LSAVLRAGVDDQNIIDKTPNAVETSPDDMSLVLDDHAEADGFHSKSLIG
jgi:hypothetical protein